MFEKIKSILPKEEEEQEKSTKETYGKAKKEQEETVDEQFRAQRAYGQTEWLKETIKRREAADEKIKQLEEARDKEVMELKAEHERLKKQADEALQALANFEKEKLSVKISDEIEEVS